MSDASSRPGGRASNWGAAVWITIFALSTIVFGVNFAFMKLDNTQESNARGLATDISVKSQQLAVQAKDAVAGNPEAFAKLKETRVAVETDINALRDGSFAAGVPSYRSAFGVGGTLQRLADTWAPIAEYADLIIRNRDQVVAFAQTADRLTLKLQPLKSRMDEVARAMSDNGAPSAQLLLAMREVSLADALARDIAVLRSGGPAVGAAGDALARESALFGQVLKGFHDGDPGLGIIKLDKTNAVASLNQVRVAYADTQQPFDAILKSTGEFAAVQDSEKQISDGCPQLLIDSQTLRMSFNTLSTHRPFPSLYVALPAGVLVLLSLFGLALYLFRFQLAQRRAY